MKLSGIYYLCHVIFPSLPGKHTCHLQCLFSAFWAPLGFAFSQKNTQARDEKKVISYFFNILLQVMVQPWGTVYRTLTPKIALTAPSHSQPASRNSRFPYFSSICRDPIYGTISTVWKKYFNLLRKEPQQGCVFWLRPAPVANKREIYIC